MTPRTREPREVAELGRPETPEETAARKAQDSRNYRARKTVNNLIYSLLAVLGVVAVIYFAVPRQDAPKDWQVDYKTVASQAASSVNGQLVTPQLPDTWRANVAELTRIDGQPAWKINFITPSSNFITYEQVFNGSDVNLNRIFTNRSLTEQREIGSNQWWSEYDNSQGNDTGQPKEYALATFGLDSAFILHGTGTREEFTTLARDVAAQIAKGTP